MPSPESSFAGQSVIVTGAGHGLGRDFALGFARHGASVVVNDVALDANGRPVAQDVVDEINSGGGRAVLALGSVADEGDVRSVIATAMSEFGRIDAVVNNAGIVAGGDLVDQSAELMTSMLAVHVLGSFLVIREAFPHLAANGGGRIVNITSGAGLFGMRTMTSYSAAKGAIVGLTHTVAIEGAEHGIRANSVAPIALTNPGRTSGAAEVFGALGPHARPEFVTPLVIYLASSLSTVTNATFSAVAGRYARVLTGLTDGWVSPGDLPPGIDEIAAHFEQISDPSSYSELQNMQEEIALLASRLS
jgi:NAD(P)-dependent dehydrogenase (short-subunit alcohol dehydrogenase family)